MTEFVLHRLASVELRKAYKWYEIRDKNVANRFLLSIEETISRILADPDSYPIERHNFRRIRVRRFPYVLIFEHAPRGHVLIIATSHMRRRPGYWTRRKRSDR
jgi:toxin ParE1/3/4